MGKNKNDVKRQPISNKLRFEVFKRDLFRCHYCGRSAPEVVLHVDHITPVSKGGTNEFTNLVTSCQDCNLGKLDTELWEREDGYGVWWGSEEEYTVKMFESWMLGVDIHKAYYILKMGFETYGKEFYAYARENCKDYRRWKPFAEKMMEYILKELNKNKREEEDNG